MKQPSLKKNYIYRLFYEVLTIIVPFVTTPYVSRVLQADGVGTYSFTYSIVAYFVLFSGLGTASYGAREISRNRTDKKAYSKLFWEIEIMTVFTSLACLVGWGALICFDTKYKIYFIALTPFILSSMVNISWFFNGLEMVKYNVIRNSVCKLLGVVFLFAFVKTKQDVVIYTIINSGVQFLGSLSMWTYLPKFLVKIDFGHLKFKKHFKETLVYFIPSIATSIYTVLDKTLIGLITNDSYQNGYYEQATKVIHMVKSVSYASVNAVMGARISYLFAENRIDEIKKRISKSMNYILLVGYGCVFGVCGIAANFIPLFMGKGFDQVITLVYLMSPLIIIIAVSNCLGYQYYTPSGKRKQSARYIIMGSCVNLCFNLLMIPFFGAYGATAASIIAELTISYMYLTHAREYMTFGKIWEYSWKRILVGVTMMAVVMGIGKADLPRIPLVVLQFLAGVITYAGVLYLLKDSMLIELLAMAGKAVARLGGKGRGNNDGKA
jgi:O-antigen/teichoic acid export membrane protein